MAGSQKRGTDPGAGSGLRLFIPSKVYAPVGHCIYCGSTTTTLEREDIVPAAMLGRLVLPQARCPDCAEAIVGCETRVVQHLLEGAHAGNWPSRGTRRRSMRGVTVTYIDPEDATALPADARPAGIMTDDIPRRIVLPQFDLPDLLEPGSPDREEFWQFMPFGDSDDHAGREGSSRPGAQLRYDRDAFCRLLAKIGHAFATATVPAEQIEAFELLLPAMIRSGTGDPFVFVGGKLRRPVATDRAHTIECRSSICAGTGTEFLVAHITLFSCFGGPEYIVVVGKRPAASPLRDPL